MYEYRCTIVRWVDGDTVDVQVDLGFTVTANQRVRLAGIDTPEMHSQNVEERASAGLSRFYAQSLAPVGAVVQIATAKARADDKYGRWLAKITLPDGRDVALTMIQGGYGKPYDGGKKEPSA